ncbi:MAG: hypothetical protein GQ534_02180 [Candidatus Delongbacteria bacterium]|nr:hypothetical protein [Candidatus Delongbacteria bacterium]
MGIRFIAIWDREDEWYNIETIDISSKELKNVVGVYILWVKSDINKVIKIGQGDICEMLLEYKNNPDILGYGKDGVTNVTWAVFSEKLLDGVEAYLNYKLKPSYCNKQPIDFLIPVNLPCD